MKLIEFPEQSYVVAKDQPEYIPMPVYAHRNPQGEITCCWKLSFIERLEVLFTGRIWHSLWTFGEKVQPQKLSTVKPDFQHITEMGDAAENEELIQHILKQSDRGESEAM